VLGLGVVLHVVIGVTFAVAFFSAAVLVLYVAFVPPDRVEHVAAGARDRFASAVRRGLFHVEDGVAAGG
jgi:hypothetical protein